MSARRARRPRTSLMPLAELIGSYRIHRQQSGRHQKHVDDGGLRLAAQLGILPDLRYLRDGLRRSLVCIQAYGNQMVPYLQGLPGPPLGPGELASEIEAMLAWINLQAWPATDHRNMDMARLSPTAAHPLDGHSLSIAYHWANLFYTAKPDETAQSSELRRAYDALMAEFSTYVLAAQARIDPIAYLDYCTIWHKTGKQPSESDHPARELAGRVAAASRIVRRLSLPKYHRLFAALTTAPEVANFDIRVQRINRPADLDERDALDAIARLLKGIAPWRRGPRRRSKRNDQKRTKGRIVREKYVDGYVRVADGACLATGFETAQGIRFETIVPRPPEAEELATELLATRTATSIEDEGLIFPTHDLGTDALALARAKLDGQQWIPVDERTPDGGMDYITVSDESGDQALQGVHPGSSSRWAADHRRRALMAHRLQPGRLQLRDIEVVLSAMRRARKESETREGAADKIALHAAIALGRSWEQGCSLEIHQSLLGQMLDPDRLHYGLAERQWAVVAPPPAWASKSVTRSERPQWSEIRLRDHTGFLELLEIHGFAVPGQPLGRPTASRRREIERWAGVRLPGTDSPLGGCGTFLFGRLLEVSRGDLGIARLITGRTHAHSESIAHYAYYDARHVWDAYSRCWVATAPAGGPSDRRQSRGRVQNTSHGYGARRVPTMDAVRALICQLQRRIRGAKGAERHNPYTAYTWLGMVVGTGLRPVVEPHLFPFASRVGSQQVATYLDKARTDYHRRVSVVPRLLAAHLDRYAHYVRGLDRDSTNSGEFRRHPFRYRACETGQFRAFRPGDFEEICEPDFDLELYSLRRFFRTQLMQDPNLTAEDVDAAMGHWFDGLSPHDRLSTYPMVRLHGLAMGAADRLLRAVSFKPLWIDQGRC